MKSLLKAVFNAFVQVHQDWQQHAGVPAIAPEIDDGKWYPSPDLLKWYYDKDRKLSAGESFLVASFGRLPPPHRDDVHRYICQKFHPDYVDKWATGWDSPRIEPSRRYHEDDEGPSARCS